ncbi:MAG: hypothetical protein KBB37_08935 [Bacteroidia bacterium]|nr:hypothetical protein [Bacteroidia bacterium]MBP7261396.1 hypothetical protein [Bacteroidia bacterium]MBP9180697.1 hypothetical protein [Bacteroidia bacterium]MBP9724582.1 hypothetical protein [Bacteroidia bacterium]
MKNKYILLLFFAAFCCMGVQCKDEDDSKPEPVLAEELAKLPKATTGGYGTFGCLLNGWAWPGYELKDAEIITMFYMNFYGKKTFNLMCRTSLNTFPVTDKDLVNIVTDDTITGPGEYTIALDDYKTDFVAIGYKGIDYHSGVSNPGALLYLNIHDMDTIRRTISGTFRTTLKDATRTQTMQLQYGRFDSRY